MFELKTNFPESTARSVKANLDDDEWYADITYGYEPFPTVFHVNSIVPESEGIPSRDELQQDLDTLLGADLEGVDFYPQIFIKDHFAIAGSLSCLAGYEGSELATQAYVEYVSSRITVILETLTQALDDTVVDRKNLALNAIQQIKHIAKLFCGWTEQGIVSLEPIWKLIGDWVINNLEEFPEPYHIHLVKFLQDIATDSHRDSITSLIKAKLTPGKSYSYYGDWILFLSANPSFCKGLESTIEGFWEQVFLRKLEGVTHRVSGYTGLVAFRTLQIARFLELDLKYDDKHLFKLRLAKVEA